MDTMLSKPQLLTELHNENASWQALLDEIGEANMTQPEVAGGWSIKDIVAHLTEWRRWSVRGFQVELNYEPEFTPPWPPALQSDDDINAWMYESQRDRPLADVLSDSREVLQQLVEALAAFSEEELQDPQRFSWLAGEPLNGRLFFSHFHDDHEPDMRAWLDKVKRDR
ncbi:ClbS/DfsB family four-helix bundle protein [Tengunoibacter tsumagoiensis]|uniref:ClbS/DfsB family four-helix bundle protein n=1 Tax=Tengunoibacter tsumagoiensis TaxID=2014871 RepID=A0A402A8N5_9CHLR|nr:ClbS/DfsB family four-helix bundle protein [Tengunoibacter tsumagoiensis]GCE15458.1 hypothetical protein KTT_53170 [Tengunoibacter tsumagoiensis]